MLRTLVDDIWLANIYSNQFSTHLDIINVSSPRFHFVVYLVMFAKICKMNLNIYNTDIQCTIFSFSCLGILVKKVKHNR